ncbi:sensor histidine kinase [Chromobacterium aquaticum]|uniref:histidine kinase n=1 Tax=Chromobacterium aquaticum TaxID=467180 RepID=A0ABV8ZRE6_9NEIS|nr:PAS domain S-box protein [Chromobacterium aquaticum]
MAGSLMDEGGALGCIEQVLSNVLEAVPVGVALIDGGMRYRLINERLAEANGLPCADHLGRRVAEVLPQIGEFLESLMRQVIASGEPVIDFCVNSWVDAGGRVAQREWQISYLPYSVAAEVVGVVAVVRDVAGERLAERLRGEGEARLRMVVDSALDGLVMIDQGGCILMANHRAEVMFDYEGVGMEGMMIASLVPERFRDGHGRLMESYMRHPEAREMARQQEIFGQRRDGGEFPAEIGLTPVRNDEEVQVLATITDISARKAAQASLELALKEKTALLNEVHHRVKNNLQVISSLLNLQTRSAPPEAVTVLVECQNHVRAMALIHQLLYEHGDFSRIHVGLYLERLTQLLSGSASESGVRVRCRGMEVAVYLGMQRAIPCGLLVNELVTNALKHAFPGRHGTVEVALERSEDGGCRILVSDDGVGIPESVKLGEVSSLGFRLIPILVGQLKGVASLLRPEAGGACVEIAFSDEPESQE